MKHKIAILASLFLFTCSTHTSYRNQKRDQRLRPYGDLRLSEKKKFNFDFEDWQSDKNPLNKLKTFELADPKEKENPSLKKANQN